jgi:tripartite-type tricarboxylate transporter receptor subunit TctC
MFARRAMLAGAASVVAAWVPDSWAQPAFPTRPVTIVAPFTPGTPADVAARRVAQAMTGTLSQSVVVENRSGAGGTTGSEYVARAEPDGYTLIAGTQSTHAINVALYRNLRYHPARSFAPISRISAAPNVVVVPATLKVGTMTELIALAKQQNAEGQPLSFGSGGSGTTAHLGAEVLKQAAGINMVHIPYRGTSQAMTDVLTGRVDTMFAPIVVALPHIQSGVVRGLSITSPDRSPLLPEVSTVRESGLPEAETEVWIGLFAPARTPDIVIGTLYDGLVRALKMPAVRESFGKEGSDVVVDASPAAFGRFVDREIATWAKVVQQSGATIE